MVAWLVNDGAVWFSAAAIGGTLFLVLQLILGEIGGDLDADGTGVDVGGLDGADALGGDLDADAMSGGDAGAEIRALSLQSLAAFAMGGGWMGLMAYRVLELNFFWSTMVAVGAGVGVAWILVSSLRAVLRLQSSTALGVRDAVGSTGTVYISVPPPGSGSGRITAIVDGRQLELSAVQDANSGATDAIVTNTPVRIVGADRAGNTVTVEPA